MLQNCIAVILAGGASSRMGIPKGLLLYKGRYWLFEQLERLKKAGVNDIIIGLGNDIKSYFDTLPALQEAIDKHILFSNLQIRVVINTQPQLGAFSTLQKALKQLKRESDVLICPIDVPVLKASELTKLINTKAKIVKPVYKNKSGHPVKISPKFAEQLLRYPNTGRLDTIILKEAKKDIVKVICNDKQVVMNLNSPKNWKNYTDNLLLTQKYTSHEN